MKRGIQFLAVTSVLAVAWAVVPGTSQASCDLLSPAPFNNGQSATPGFLILADAGADLGGFMWEQNEGDPADGAGNDGNSLVFGPPGGGDQIWFTRTGPPGTANIFYNWSNGGVDGCPTVIGGGVMAAYVLDNSAAITGVNYAILAVTGNAPAAALYDFDKVNGGAPNANDVPLKPLGLAPLLQNLSIVDALDILADVLPVEDSVNYYDDQVAGSPPYANIFDTGTQLITRLPGGGDETPIPGCDGNGCIGATIPRDRELCWDSSPGPGAQPTGQATIPPSGSCSLNDLTACTGDPDCVPVCDENVTVTCGGPDPDSTTCFGGFFGVCTAQTCAGTPAQFFPFGPPVPDACVLIAGPTVSDRVLETRAVANGRFLTISFSVIQFTVQEYNIVSTKKGERLLKNVARQGGNNGQIEDYTVILSRGDLKGSKNSDLFIDLIRTDGTVIRSSVE